MHLRKCFFIAMACSAITFAQSPVTADSPFQVRYISNLNVGDSVINMTNTGARGGVELQSGTTASTGGSICVNVYAFSPDEQMISCCSCPVTPNGLTSLSARNDLINNTLTPAVPNAIVIKLLATAPVVGSCNAANATTATIVPGLAAWGTTLHATPTGNYSVTETAFTPASLSASELARLGALCTFIQANGSGYGICRSCRLGGLSADKL